MGLRTLKIRFLNSRGLSTNSLASVSSWLSATSSNNFTPPADVVFVAETWHQDIPAYKLSPFYVSSSPRSSTSTSVRGIDGLLCLVSSSLKSQCSAVATGEFFLSVKIGSAVLTGVYLPPRLSTAELTPILEALPASELVIGDLNFRRRSNGDRENIAPE